MRAIDPTAMTEIERLDDLAELLARGFQRWLVAERKTGSSKTGAENCSNRLDVPRDGEAPCGRSRVRSPQSPEPTP
jgi:hypothetical protein